MRREQRGSDSNRYMPSQLPLLLLLSLLVAFVIRPFISTGGVVTKVDQLWTICVHVPEPRVKLYNTMSSLVAQREGEEDTECEQYYINFAKCFLERINESVIAVYNAQQGQTLFLLRNIIFLWSFGQTRC